MSSTELLRQEHNASSGRVSPATLQPLQHRYVSVLHMISPLSIHFLVTNYLNQIIHSEGQLYCNVLGYNKEINILNIMFHAPMGRLQLELIYCFTFIFHRRPI